MIINIEVELLFILAAIGVFILWLIYNSFSHWILKKRYKPENEKSRKGGFERVTDGGGESSIIKEPDTINGGITEPKESRELPLPEVVVDGKADNSSRKTRKSFRGFRRRRK